MGLDLELLLNPLVGGELAQVLGDLPAVLDREEPQVAVPLAEHVVVCLSDVFRRGSEGGEGVGVPGLVNFLTMPSRWPWLMRMAATLAAWLLISSSQEDIFLVMMDGRDLRFQATGLVYLL